jgi:hypothetical protein
MLMQHTDEGRLRAVKAEILIEEVMQSRWRGETRIGRGFQSTLIQTQGGKKL